MTSLFRSSIANIFVTFLLVLAVAAPRTGRAQGKYTEEEYAAYDQLNKETDPAKKTALVVQFLKARPQSTLKENAVSSYQQGLASLQTQGKWAELATLGEQFAAVEPKDDYTKKMLQAAYSTLATTALTNNDPKFLQWGEKVISTAPDNYEILVALTTKYAELNRYDQAAKTAKQALTIVQGITKTPAGVSEDAWKKYTTNTYAVCYAIMGNVAYQNQDYTNAVLHLENSLKYNPKNDLAYYNLGMSYWRQNRLDLAMLDFAKAYALKGRMSANAKTYLDSLYKPGHGNSLVGQERIIAKAQADLGIK